MSAGRLKNRIRFERRRDVRDGIGNTRGEWQEQFTRAAEIRPLRGSEEVMAARLQGTQPVLVIVRYDSQTETIETDWRAVDARKGTIYAVMTVADMEQRRQFLTLMCKAGGPA